MSPASQWRLGVSGAISYYQLARRGIDRWPVLNATAIISQGGKNRAECAVVFECVTCLKRVSLNYFLIYSRGETGLSSFNRGLMLL